MSSVAQLRLLLKNDVRSERQRTLLHEPTVVLQDLQENFRFQEIRGRLMNTLLLSARQMNRALQASIPRSDRRTSPISSMRFTCCGGQENSSAYRCSKLARTPLLQNGTGSCGRMIGNRELRLSFWSPSHTCLSGSMSWEESDAHCPCRRPR